MHIVRSWEELPPLNPPLALTIGTFDGVHLGHQTLFAELKKRAPQTLVLTFSNHPLEVVRPEQPLSFLCSAEEKISLIENQGIDYLLLLLFSQSLADLSYRDFIEQIRRYIPFTTLILGEGAAFGKDRAGNPQRIKKLADELGFEVVYLPKVLYEGQPISSQRIRKALATGDRALAEKLLGRSCAH